MPKYRVKARCQVFDEPDEIISLEVEASNYTEAYSKYENKVYNDSRIMDINIIECFKQ